MRKNVFCQICKQKVNSRKVTTRTKRKLKIFECKICDFEFFLNKKKNNLKNDKLDDFRLKKIGLKINQKKQDILNGIQQAREYIEIHLKGNKKLKILDIGCSWGYFLDQCKKKGHDVYGLEVNKIRKNYVNKKLKIKCFETIKDLPKIEFDKIFLFYSLEYIGNPQEYIKSLKDLLKKRGEIIIYTPNKNDHINQILNINNYNNFFYEENSINYFSKKSLVKLAENIKSKYKIELNQGYSFINLLNWFFHKKPFDTGFVGKDYFIDDLVKNLKKNDKKNKTMKRKLITYFIELNKKFKKLIVNNNISNTIIFKVKW